MATRKICEIAADVRRTWPKVWFGAVPYLEAMESLSEPTDMYGADDAKSIVIYFLSNTATWKGDDARRIKKELKSLVGIK